MQAELKEIPTFPNYSITPCGDIFNSKTNRWLKPTMKGGGYFHVGLLVRGKYKYKTVHRLIMETYKPIEDMESFKVDHINGVKTDNRLDNLRWCTQPENVRFTLEQGTNSGYNRRRNVICNETREIYESCAEAGRKCRTSQGSIYNCCSGRSKSAANRTFSFLIERVI